MRLAVVGYLILALATVGAFGWLVVQRDQSCRDRKHQWAAVHDIIQTAYAPSAPSDAVLNAFPALKPFYTPGNPSYEAQQRSLMAQRDRVLGKLGARPAC